MGRNVTVRTDMVKLGKEWQRSFKPLGDKVIRDAKFIAQATAPRRGDPRPGKSENLSASHSGHMMRGGGVLGNFFLKNSASYAMSVIRGRRAVYARGGGRLKVPRRGGGGFIYPKKVDAALPKQNSDWMTQALKKSMRMNGLASRVNTHMV